MSWPCSKQRYARLHPPLSARLHTGTTHSLAFLSPNKASRTMAATCATRRRLCEIAASATTPCSYSVERCTSREQVGASISSHFLRGGFDVSSLLWCRSVDQDAEMMRLQLLGDPNLMNQVRQVSGPLSPSIIRLRPAYSQIADHTARSPSNNALDEPRASGRRPKQPRAVRGAHPPNAPKAARSPARGRARTHAPRSGPLQHRGATQD